MIHFSPTNKGFYDSGIHKNIPLDSIEISKEKYDELLDGQSKGFEIDIDANGNPILKEIIAPEKTYEELRKSEYPPIEDYIDGIVKGDDLQVQEYIRKCLEIKNKYPKE